MTSMPGRSYRGPLPPLTARERDLSGRLQAHVRVLADEIGPRHMARPHALQLSTQYISAALARQGYEVASQEYLCDGLRVRNLQAGLPADGRGEAILVVGAHYDSVPDCPGADDNASGVSALIEVARLLRGQSFDVAVRFVAFVNEEPPYFQTDLMGSRVYARACAERGERVVAMLSLETLGCYSDEPGSQRYPFPFSLFYPGTGNFVGFVGNMKSRGLVRRAVGSFRSHTPLPSEGAAVPGFITGIGWSDHWAFWQEGTPALMVTDTAPFRYADYHGPADTPDKLDYDRLARVTMGLARTVAALASGAS